MPTKLRYVPEASYARGNETRTRLISAALHLFGERGFAAASTRDIATAAALNTPALQYYFNNKEGLYVACAQHIIERGWGVMKNVVVATERMLAGGADDEALIGAYCAVQDRLADFVGGATGDWLLWMAREQASGDANTRFLLDHRYSKRLAAAGRAIVARLLGRAPRDPESLIHEMILNGQLTPFCLMRAQTLDVLRWRTIDAAGLALIKRVVRRHSVASLRAIAAARGAAGSSKTAGPSKAAATERNAASVKRAAAAKSAAGRRRPVAA
jgi:AcrR family transcriptional regulator